MKRYSFNCNAFDKGTWMFSISAPDIDTAWQHALARVISECMLQGMHSLELAHISLT